MQLKGGGKDVLCSTKSQWMFGKINGKIIMPWMTDPFMMLQRYTGLMKRSEKRLLQGTIRRVMNDYI